MGGTVAIYQPHYYPRLHYLARAQQADTFVIYDDVEFSGRSNQHRAPIDHFDEKWLTAPVNSDDTNAPIHEVRLSMSDPWPSKHLKTLVGKYGEQAEELREFYDRLCASVVDLEFLRENAAAVKALADDRAAEDLVADCLRWDAEWRKRLESSDLEELEADKERITDRIAERKRGDPEADIESLVDTARAIEERLAEVRATCREAKERRNRAAVDLSQALGDHADVEYLSMAGLWELDGIDPARLMSDVKLVELTVPILEELLVRFEVGSTVVRSSEVPVDHPGDASEYLARLTEYVGGDSYLSGEVGYDNYVDETPFVDRGIEILVQNWSPSWPEGNVCALDVLYDAEEPARYVG